MWEIRSATALDQPWHLVVTSNQRVLQHHAPEQAAAFRPKEDGRDGFKRFCHTHTPHSDAPLMLKIPAQHLQNLCGTIEMRRPSPHNWKANAVECFGQVKHQCDRSWVLFACPVVEYDHLRQSLPHNALSSSISSVRGIPLDSILSLPFRKLWRPQSSHQRIVVGRSTSGARF